MTTLTDVRFKTLRGLLFTGSTSDMLLQWLQANSTGTPKTIPDAWRDMLDTNLLSPSTGNRSDDWFQLLADSGFKDAGAMNDRELAFWDGGAILPVATAFIITEGGDALTTEAGDNLII